MNELDWAQKYRPATFDDLVLPPGLSTRLRKFIADKGGMSLMFTGNRSHFTNSFTTPQTFLDDRKNVIRGERLASRRQNSLRIQLIRDHPVGQTVRIHANNAVNQRLVP